MNKIVKVISVNYIKSLEPMEGGVIGLWKLLRFLIV